ncbi:TetR/AcrR family transcriptional regulator [Paenibacillus sp. 1001270B_150601_E10]|uniref:TetR/AcrR family transcriptional regulator n=1 Tax=Paenibacillus sp. 1001270B_150601_E10 TaxID=2787079 RepID=UPI001E3D4173|nr:TetR/AcrR family transcriptional regulator [Paenibacillus sp. 1001270B_150601_E10]
MSVERNQHEEEWIKLLNQLEPEEREKMTDKQQRIVAAALDIFSEKGYAAASTNEIAKKAGVAEGTIFRHYKTKKELLFSILSPMMTKLLAPFLLRELKQIVDTPYDSYAQFVAAILKNRHDFFIKHKQAIRLLIQEIPFHEELKEEFINTVSEQLFERARLVVERYKAVGELIDMPSPIILRFTLTNVIGFLLVRHLFLPNAEWEQDEVELERTVQLIMHGIASFKS